MKFSSFYLNVGLFNKTKKKIFVFKIDANDATFQPNHKSWLNKTARRNNHTFASKYLVLSKRFVWVAGFKDTQSTGSIQSQ